MARRADIFHFGLRQIATGKKSFSAGVLPAVRAIMRAKPIAQKNGTRAGNKRAIESSIVFQALKKTGELISGEQKAVSRATRKRRLLAQRTSNFGSKKPLG